MLCGCIFWVLSSDCVAFWFSLQRLQKCQLYITATKVFCKYLTYKTKHCWRSIEAYDNVLSIHRLLPSLIVWIFIWTYWLPFWLIDTQPLCKAQPSYFLAQVTVIQLKYINLAEWFISPTVHLLMIYYLHSTAHYFPVMFLWVKFLVKQQIELRETTWCILSYILLFPSFRLVLIPVIVINPFSDIFINHHVGENNLSTLHAALTIWGSGLARFPMT
jgi:hypothetical protein